MKPDSTDDRHPVEILAEEYVERRRAGDSPNLTEYVERHPEWAEEIREVFPTMLMMERMRPDLDELEPAAAEPISLEQLGDFRIVREVGRGGMGVVYEAIQESLGRHVALKILSGRSLNNERRLRRFQREARTAAMLHHTNIVPVFGAGEQEGMHYLVMQFITGQGLDEVLRALNRCHANTSDQSEAKSVEATAPVDSGSADTPVPAALLARTLLSAHSDSFVAPVFSDTVSSTSETNRRIPGASTADESPLLNGSALSQQTSESDRQESLDSTPTTLVRSDQAAELGKYYWRNVAHLGLQVASALQYAHAHGTLHRDIKPANLLLDTQGTVWVADFGLAKLMRDDDLTNSGDVVGTLAYMAPEQFSGHVDHRSDLYSLGLTLYELSTLRQAYDERDRNRLIRQVTQHDPTPPRRIQPQIPRDLETIIQKAITREPAERYQSAQAMADDLNRFLNDVPIHARRISAAERLWRWCRRNRAIAVLSGLAVTLLVTIAAISMVGNLKLRRAFNATAKALERESEQLEIAQEERRRAEVTLDVALLVLDKVFEQATPPSSSVAELGSDVENPILQPQFEPVINEQNAALLQSLLTFYDQFTEQDRATLQVQIKSGQAHRRVGEIQLRLGQAEQAVDAFQRSVSAFERLVNRYPSVSQYERELAQSLNGLGSAQRRIRNFTASAETHQKALIRLEATAANAEEDARFRDLHECVLTMNQLGITYAMAGESERGEETLHRALAVLDELTDHSPHHPDYRHAEFQVRRSLSGLLFFSRRPAAARAMHLQGIQMLESLVEQYPNSPRYSYDLADMYTFARVRPGNREQQVERNNELRRAMELSRQLVERYPQVPEYELLLSRSLTRLGQVSRMDEKLDMAERRLREALTILRGLNDRFPSISLYYSSLARTGRELGRVLCESGELVAAREVQETAIQNQLLFLKLEDGNRFDRLILSRQYRDLSETLALLGESTLAEDAAAKSDLHSGLRRADDESEETEQDQPEDSQQPET